MAFDPNIPRFDKRAMVVCVFILTLLIAGVWLVHNYVVTDYSHPSQPFSPPSAK